MVAKSRSFIVFLIAVMSASVFGLEAADLEAAGNSSRIELPEESQSVSEFAG